MGRRAAPTGPARDAGPDPFLALLPKPHTEEHRRRLTEIYWGAKRLEKLHVEHMSHYPNVEVLWLNDNMLSKVSGLEKNFRIKELFLQNNRITTLLSASCSLPKLRHLERLNLANNLLQDLKATLKVLQVMPFLQHLHLCGNPLSEESDYRATVLFALPALRMLDDRGVTAVEREAAVKLFTAKKIEVKMAFMQILRPYDKDVPRPRGARSLGEEDLLRAVQQNARRGAREVLRAEALACREALQPQFEVRSETTGYVPGRALQPSAHSQTFDFRAKGLVPELRVRASALSLTAAGAAAAADAAALASAHGGEPEVLVSFDAMRVRAQPLRSRRVSAALAARAAVDLRFDGELFDGYGAASHERVLQLMQTGPEAEMCLQLCVCEAVSGHVIGSATVSLSALLRERQAACAAPAVELLSAAARHGGVARPEVVGTLDVSVDADWNLSYKPADYLYQRRMRKLAEEAAAAPQAEEGARARQSKDFFEFSFRKATAKAEPALSRSAGGAEVLSLRKGLPPPARINV